MSIRFSSALEAAMDWVKSHAALLPKNLALIRDLYGRIRIALPPGTNADGAADAIWQELHALLGPYSPGVENLLLSGDTLLAPDAIFHSQDLVPLEPSSLTGPFLLDRLITGGDWLRPEFPNAPPRVPRATFYGLKGGVGRSTALALFARHLAGRGKNVLVLDLDLESPGVGSLLLPSNAFPPSGLVDWFVEDAVGAADAELLDELTAISPLAALAPGRSVSPRHTAWGRWLTCRNSPASLSMFADQMVWNPFPCAFIGWLSLWSNIGNQMSSCWTAAPVCTMWRPCR